MSQLPSKDDLALPAILKRTPPKAAIIDGAFIGQVQDLFIQAGFELVWAPMIADVVVWIGGDDIDPALYGEKPIDKTHTHLDRDIGEIAIYRQNPLKKKIGICRGAQLLNVLGGGKMYQDCDGHNGGSTGHMMVDTRDNSLHRVSSLHHQMMVPAVTAEVIGMAGRSTYYRTDSITTRLTDPKPDKRDPKGWDEPEIVWYPQTTSLCYQGHPEIGSESERIYFWSLVRDFLDLQAPTLPKLKV